MRDHLSCEASQYYTAVVQWDTWHHQQFGDAAMTCDWELVREAGRRLLAQLLPPSFEPRGSFELELDSGSEEGA